MTSSDVSTLPFQGPEAGTDQCAIPEVHPETVRAALARMPSEAEVAAAVEVAGVLSNPTRLRLLLALCPSDGAEAPALCVCDLSAVVGASETATSHQLRLLRLSGLVEQRREGRMVYYRAAQDPALQAAVAALSAGARRWQR